MALAEACERRVQLGQPLALVLVPEAADQRRTLDVGGTDVRCRPGRVRDPCDRPLVTGLPCSILDVRRVDDQRIGRGRSTSPASGKSCGRVSQSGGMRLSSTP